MIAPYQLRNGESGYFLMYREHVLGRFPTVEAAKARAEWEMTPE